MRVVSCAVGSGGVCRQVECVDRLKDKWCGPVGRGVGGSKKEVEVKVVGNRNEGAQLHSGKWWRVLIG